MNSVDWPKFFQELPESERELAIIVLRSGTEVSLHRLMKFFENFMVVRGRLGGTDASGLIFCVPYDQIECVFFSRVQMDEVVVEMFGDIIGGVKRAYLLDPEEEARKKAEEEAAAAEAAALEPGPDGALPALPRGAPVNVSALRSRLLHNRSKRVDPRTRQH